MIVRTRMMDVLWVALGVVALGLVVVLAAWSVWLRVRPRLLRRRPRLPRPRHPVVLVHGVLGFDELRVGNIRHAYFRGLHARGQHAHFGDIELHRPTTSPTGSIALRAERLAEYVESISSRRVNIIAHSMGGLDARYAVSKLGLAKRVASVITVGTPHRGTPIADVGASLINGALGLKRVAAVMGVTLDAFDDLTTTKMARFNDEVRDARGVTYGCVLARPELSRSQVNKLLLPSYLYLLQRDGPNDGLVPLHSQSWGTVLTTIEADHWGQIGWSRTFDAGAFYTWLLCELRAMGL